MLEAPFAALAAASLPLSSARREPEAASCGIDRHSGGQGSQEIRGGVRCRDVSDEVVLTSSVSTDIIAGPGVTFPSASPHTITAYHPQSGAMGSSVIEVIPDPAPASGATSGPTPRAPGSAGLASSGAELTPALPLAGAALLLAGGVAIAAGGYVRRARPS